MQKPKILGIGTANPGFFLSQQEVYDFYDRHSLMPEGQKNLYARLLLNGRIKGRYFALNNPAEIINEDPDSQISRFTAQGRKVLAGACRKALEETNLSPGDVGGIVVTTCTGYLCPGLTSYLAEDLKLNTFIKAVDITGMGCGSSIPGLECGCGILERTPGKPVICASVEICSATHLIEDEPGVTVSNCIFGDGAAAVVLGYQNPPDGRITLHDFQTGLFPRYREALRYKNRRGHLCNTLTRKVPVIGARCLGDVTRKLLDRNSLELSDINWWAVHAGGTEVLESVKKHFNLPSGKLGASFEVFENYGNMSSPTVLFVLQKLMKGGLTRGPGLILGFGAGFTAFAALAYGDESH